MNKEERDHLKEGLMLIGSTLQMLVEEAGGTFLGGLLAALEIQTRHVYKLIEQADAVNGVLSELFSHMREAGNKASEN